MSTPGLFPLNDLALLATLKTVSQTTGKAVTLTSGTVTAFLATSSGPSATAADATLTATVTYLSSVSKWLIEFDGAALTAALLNTHFAAATPYLIIQSTGNLRTASALAYSATRTVTPA
jgi:hypothetical protein